MVIVRWFDKALEILPLHTKLYLYYTHAALHFLTLHCTELPYTALHLLTVDVTELHYPVLHSHYIITHRIMKHDVSGYYTAWTLSTWFAVVVSSTAWQRPTVKMVISHDLRLTKHQSRGSISRKWRFIVRFSLGHLPDMTFDFLSCADLGQDQQTEGVSRSDHGILWKDVRQNENQDEMISGVRLNGSGWGWGCRMKIPPSTHTDIQSRRLRVYGRGVCPQGRERKFYFDVLLLTHPVPTV